MATDDELIGIAQRVLRAFGGAEPYAANVLPMARALKAEIADAEQRGGDAERADVLAWLAESSGEPGEFFDDMTRGIRECIERGEHRKERGDGTDG